MACRELGFRTGRPLWSAPYDTTMGWQPLWLTSVACYGNESRLADCPSSGFLQDGGSWCWGDKGKEVGLACIDGER